MPNTLKCFTVWLLILLTACQLKTHEILPTPMPTQTFLPRVSPEPGERISYEEYKVRSEINELGLRVGPICVYYDAYHVIEIGDDGFEAKDYLSRSQLLVNGEVWPNSEKPDLVINYLGLVLWENSEKGNEVGPYDFCWNIELTPGMHTIEFKTRTTSGKELSYNWSFIITE